MKRVILSEGRNDRIFLEELLTTKMCIEKRKILFFDQNSRDVKSDLKHSETKVFGKLETDWLPYELLVKSESGKKKIIGITLSELPNLCEKGYNPIILIDLDGGQIEEFTSELQEKLIRRFKGNNLRTEPKESHRVNDALMHSIDLFFNNTTFIGTLYVIGFFQTLECVTGIDNAIHQDEDKRKLSQKYIKESQIHEVFNKALRNESICPTRLS